MKKLFIISYIFLWCSVILLAFFLLQTNKNMLVMVQNDAALTRVMRLMSANMHNMTINMENIITILEKKK